MKPSLSVSLNVYLGLMAFLVNLGQAWLFRRYGFLSSILLRVFFYLIWHMLWGFLGY